MKKLFMLTLVILLTLSLLVGCGANQEQTTTETTETTETNESNEASSAIYTDGTYKATYSHIDGHGWRPEVVITVKDGKITEAKMDYVNPEGKLKSEDEGYAERMKAKSGVTPKEAFDKLNEDLVSKQDISKVDVVTGATHTAENFIELAEAALENAKKGDTTEVILPMNDTYTASDDIDDHGWKAEVAITFENGKIVKVDYKEVNEEGTIKSEDEGYAERMSAKSGITPAEAEEKLESALVEAQDIEKVDVVSGATGSSERFKKLVKEALAKRVAYKN